MDDTQNVFGQKPEEELRREEIINLEIAKDIIEQSRYLIDLKKEQEEELARTEKGIKQAREEMHELQVKIREDPNKFQGSIPSYLIERFGIRAFDAKEKVEGFLEILTRNVGEEMVIFTSGGTQTTSQIGVLPRSFDYSLLKGTIIKPGYLLTNRVDLAATNLQKAQGNNRFNSYEKQGFDLTIDHFIAEYAFQTSMFSPRQTVKGLEISIPNQKTKDTMIGGNTRYNSPTIRTLVIGTAATEEFLERDFRREESYRFPPVEIELNRQKGPIIKDRRDPLAPFRRE